MGWQERAARTLGPNSRGRCRWQSGSSTDFLTLAAPFRRGTLHPVPLMAPRGDTREKGTDEEGFLPIPSAGATEKLTSSFN